MDFSNYRYWYKTWGRLVGKVDELRSLIPRLDEVSPENLLDESFRRAHLIMLPTGVIDIHGKEIYEGDILEVYTSRSRSFQGSGSISMYGYVEYSPDSAVFTVDLSNKILLQQGLDCEVVSNFYDTPKWIEDFGANKELVERWSR